MKEMGESYRPEPCPLEEEVILAFHDGEPGSAPAELAAHLERCPSCRRALEEVRALEALVATHTGLEISEEEADAFLSFLHQGQDRKPLPLGSPRLAALLLGALALAWITLRPLPLPPPPPLQASLLLDLPGGFRFSPRPKPKTSWTAEELLAALKGKFEGPRASRPPVCLLAKEALRLLEKERNPSLLLPAARWLLEETPFRGRSRVVTALSRRLLRARGKERLLLAGIYRKRPSLFFPSRSQGRKKPSLQAARLAGALGYVPALPSLASAPFPLQEAAAREALATGDGPSLSFLLDLYLEASLRFPESGKKGREWFLLLPPGKIASLGALLKEKEKNRGRKYPDSEMRSLRKFLASLSLRGGGGI